MNLDIKKEPVGIISKPQFDMNIFEKGLAIKVVAVYANKTNLQYGFNASCLVTKASPLAINIAYVDNDGDVDNYEITIGHVVEGYVDITMLK